MAEGTAVGNTTGTYQHTINGLLQKQAEMMEEIGATRERLAVLSNERIVTRAPQKIKAEYVWQIA